MVDISVVIITKNQDWNIRRLLNSVLRSKYNNIIKEVVIVDSASKDKTISIAVKFPVNIFRLRDNQLLTPSAGRYVGVKQTSGDLILFLDGDMELCERWLEKAVKIIRKENKIAAITGKIIDLPKYSLRDQIDVNQGKVDDRYIYEAKYTHGAALYKREVLDEVGNFIPHFYSDEEPEISIRIRNAGYKIMKTNLPIVYHYTENRKLISTLFSRRKRNLYLGFGQIIRYHLKDDMLWAYLKERGFGCSTIIVLIFLFSCITIFVSLNLWVGIFLFIMSIFCLIAFISFKKKNLYDLLYVIFHRAIISEGTIRGFLLAPKKMNKYSPHFDSVKKIKI